MLKVNNKDTKTPKTPLDSQWTDNSENSTGFFFTSKDKRNDFI